MRIDYMNKDTIEFLWSLLKGKFYTCKFSKCGNRLAIHGKLRLHFSNAQVEVADHVKIWPNVKLSVNGTAEEPARLVIGEGVSLGDRTEIHVGKEVTIGDHCVISWDCCILDRDYHCFNSEKENMRPVHIGNHVWIGCRCLICKGVTIGDGAVIAAGSVVTHDVAPNTCVCGGNSRCIKTDIYWK